MVWRTGLLIRLAVASGWPCACAGLNMLNQAREFNGCVKLTGLILTKLDGSARGGAVVGEDSLSIAKDTDTYVTCCCFNGSHSAVASRVYTCNTGQT